MTIGTSLGAFHDTEMDMMLAPHTLPGNDNNVIIPETTPDLDTNDQNELPHTHTSAPATEIKVNDEDYDYDAWKKANPDVEMKPGQHYPDTYKLPNHITFSDDSKYSNEQTPGGKWTHEGDDEKTGWTFTPSKFNLSQHSREEYEDYFNRVERPNGNDISYPK